jgi:hypothetical protein
LTANMRREGGPDAALNLINDYKMVLNHSYFNLENFHQPQTDISRENFHRAILINMFRLVNILRGLEKTSAAEI